MFRFLKRSRKSSPASRKPAARYFRLQVENLESRIVPSLTATLLGSNALSITGPNGASIEIDGAWRDSSDGSYLHVYTASGDLTLRSAQGDFTFTEDAATPLTVFTGVDSDELDSVVWTGPVLSTDSGPFASFHDRFGATLTLPSVPWNIQQGAELAIGGVQLDPDEAYITFGVDSGYAAVMRPSLAALPRAAHSR
jgi:hypothetical protein